MNTEKILLALLEARQVLTDSLSKTMQDEWANDPGQIWQDPIAKIDHLILFFGNNPITIIQEEE